MPMTDYRPLSKIGLYEPDLDTLHETLEPWMRAAVLEWLDQFLWGDHGPRRDFIRSLEMTHRLQRIPAEPADAAYAIRNLVASDPVFGMDAIAFGLSRLGRSNPDLALVQEMMELLRQGGSAWEVSLVADQFCLSRRDLGAAKAAIAAIEPSSARARGLLTEAWGKVACRDPDPNGGYDKAVKAVEASAQPVVSPSNTKATLGTIVRDLRVKPSKWEFELGDIDLVIAMSERLWNTHIRHGTDPRPRTDHTLPEADAALHLAIALVRFFLGGLVRISE